MPASEALGVPVILFKSPSSSSSSQADPYETHLLNAGYQPIWSPVLAERFILDRLAEILREGPKNRKGVVISSKRGAEAWVRAVSQITSNVPNAGRISWADIPLYAVGASSVDVLDAAALKNGWKPGKRKIVIAKSASALLPLIIESNGTASADTDNGYLLLRGDKTLDELSNGLRAHGEQVEEVAVYETTPRDDLPSVIESTCIDLLEERSPKDVWMAFFAPSSAGMTLPHLSRFFPTFSRLHCQSTASEAAGGRIRIFAIGETTATFLRSQGLRVEAVAEEPTAEGMVRAMQNLESGSTQCMTRDDY